MPIWLRNKHALVLSLVLLLQAAAFWLMPRDEAVPLNRSFREFPASVQGWNMVGEREIEAEVQALLKADETMSRTYEDPSGRFPVSLLVAFFRTQRAGVSPHSPRVCLPGSGWEITDARTLAVSVPGRPEAIRVNRHRITKDSHHHLVLYWYQQTGRRVVANEYAAKLYLMLDSIRYRRSDASLVRVIVPVAGASEEAAEKTAVRFIQDFFQPLSEFLPR